MYLQFHLYDNVELNYFILVTHFVQEQQIKEQQIKGFIGQTKNENCIEF